MSTLYKSKVLFHSNSQALFGALFLCLKGGADMVSTLILLYALNTSGTIPEGCFIAAWVLASVELVIRILAGLAKMNDK